MQPTFGHRTLDPFSRHSSTICGEKNQGFHPKVTVDNSSSNIPPSVKNSCREHLGE